MKHDLEGVLKYIGIEIWTPSLGIAITAFLYDIYMFIFWIEKQTILNLGEVGYASDKLGLHSIHTNGEDAISLHLYSPPITTVKIFEPETRSTLKRNPGFYSKYGVRTWWINLHAYSWTNSMCFYHCNYSFLFFFTV